MHYLALLYGEETEVAAPTEAIADEIARYDRFDELAGEAMVSGAALEPMEQAIVVRHGDDGPVVTDGVFGEATEVIGGLYVFEVDDLDDAIALARSIPAVEDGAVELRPLEAWSESRRSLPEGARRYVVMLAGPEIDASRPGTSGWDDGVAAHAQFGRAEADAILGGGALQPSESGTVLRVQDGELLITEGTLAEATEVIGGLYLLWADGRTQIERLAASIPMGPDGCVQVRPIMELDD